MGRKRRSQAGVRDSAAEIALPAPAGNNTSQHLDSPIVDDEEHAECLNTGTGNNWISRFRRTGRQGGQHVGPVKRLRRSISISHQHLRALPNDELCLSVVSELLPQQLINEVRAQLQGGSSQLEAVECASKRHLGHLAGIDVAKLFLVLAGSVSGCCGVVHVAKGLVRFVAKPLHLRRPVGLVVNNVLMPTSLYGPLLGAYLAVSTAKGALRQLSAEAAAAVGKSSSSSSGRLEGQHQDSPVEEKEGEAGETQAHLLTAKKIAEWEETMRLEKEKAQKEEEAQKLLASKRSSAGQRRQQQQQQQKQQGKPWWAVWRRRQQQQPAAAAVAAAAGPACSSSSFSNCSSGHLAKGPPTPGRHDATAGSVCSPKAEVCCDSSGSQQFSRSSSNRSNSGQSQRPAVPPLPAAPAGSGGTLLHRSTHKGQQQQQDGLQSAAPAGLRSEQDGSSSSSPMACSEAEKAPQQQQQYPSHFSLPAAACQLSPTHRVIQEAADEAAVAYSECEDGHEDHQQLHEDAVAGAGDLAAAQSDPLAAVRTRCWAINLRTGTVDSGEASDTASPCSELDGQVSKLQRRWSSGDPEVLIEEAMRAQMLLAPFRPPVFSRLASGKGGCKITAAAAAAKEDEEKHHLGDGVRVSASLDLGSSAERTGLQQLLQQQEQEGSSVAEQQCQLGSKMHRSLDFGHRLVTAQP